LAYLAQRKLIDPITLKNLLGNEIVLVAHGADAKPVEIAEGFDLAGALGGGKLAMASVDSVPAGKYGKAALQALGVQVHHDMRAGLAGCDVVVMLRLQSERMRGALLPSAGEFFKHYGLTPDAYRAKWNRPADYPMVAPNYAAQRRVLAKKIGLGRTPGAKGRRGRGRR